MGPTRVRIRGATAPFRCAPALLLALAASCADGGDDDPSPSAAPPGFWFGQGTEAPGGPRPHGLGGVGYAPGYQPDEGGWQGLRVEEAGPGPVGLPALFSSGHEPAAFLLGADGEVTVGWSLAKAGPSTGLLPPFEHPSQRAWRAVLPLPKGELLAVHEGLCLLKLDADSKVVWSGAPRAHHDVCLLDGDRACVLDRERRPRLDDGRAPHDAPHLSEDGVAIVSLETGETLVRHSIVDALAASRWSSLLDESWANSGVVEIGDGTGDIEFGLDPLHANGVELDPDAEGREVALLFLRDLGATARMDLATGELLSLTLGSWVGAHDPRPVPGRPGWVALFDNLGARDASPRRSRVIATDGVRTEEIATDGASYFSIVCGSIAPLPRGGWLVTSTTEGRALAFDPKGSLAWEFRTPFRIQADGLIAALLDMRPLQEANGR